MWLGLLCLTAGLTACLSALATGPEVPSFPDGTTRVLFIGNSLTSVEDVPGRVVQIARQYGDSSVRVAMIAAPNYALIDHLAGSAARAALTESRWEFVVLQQGPSSLPENQLLLRDWSALFAPLIRDAGAMSVHYGVWPHRSRPLDMPAVERAYYDAARHVQGEFAGAGTAWYRALAVQPSLPLYAADGLHAAPMGAYLSALVLASRILGRDPTTLPPVAPGVRADTSTVRLLQRIARDVLEELDSSPNPQLQPDAPGVAREAWAGAAAARRAGRPQAALALAERAAESWPVQPAYAQGVLRLAREIGDSTAARRTVRRLARLVGGAGRERSTGVRLADDSTLFPEGLAADPRRGVLYVSSLTHRAIYVADRVGGWRRLLGGPGDRLAPPVATTVDAQRDQLIVATGPVPEAGPMPDGIGSELVVARLADAVVVQRVPLGDGRVTPGDVAVLPDGDVVVSDATHGTILRWHRATGTFTTLRHAWLRSPQGMVPTADGRRLYVADWSHGLLRLSLETSETTRLAEPAGATLVGIDGLVGEAGTLIGVQNGAGPSRIVQVRLSNDGGRIVAIDELDRPANLPGEATTAAVLDGELWYLASSHWPFRDAEGKRRQPETPLPVVVARRLALTGG